MYINVIPNCSLIRLVVLPLSFDYFLSSLFRIPIVNNFEPPCLRPAHKEPNGRLSQRRRHMTISESAEEVMMKQIVSRMQDPFEGLEVVLLTLMKFRFWIENLFNLDTSDRWFEIQLYIYIIRSYSDL